MNKVKRIHLSAYRSPDAKESASDKFIKWGNDNRYPNYLLTLFDRSATHGAIVKAKVDYIVGQGVKNADGNAISWKPNRFMNATEFLRRITFDYEVFGGYAIQVIKRADNRGVSEVYPVPFHYFRLNKEKDRLFYSDKWEDNPRKYDEFKRYYNGIQDETSVIWDASFTPGNSVYPKPEYSQGIASIQTDAEIANWHLNNIVNGFSAGTMISFNNGVPSDPEQDAIVKEVKGQHGGSDNAGDIVVVFSDGTDRAPTILDLKGNDLDKKFEQLKAGTQEQIFVAHRVTSPMLLGVKTPGQLGGRTELIEAYEMFKRTYIEPKQRKMLDVLQYCALLMGASDVMTIEPLSPIQADFTFGEQTIAANLTRVEIRELISKQFGINLQDEAIQTKQVKCNHGKHSDTDKALLKAFEMLGESEDDFDIIDEVDVDMAKKQILVKQAVLSDEENKVLKAIKDNPKITAVSISEALGIDIDSVLKHIEALSELNYIRTNEAGFESTNTGTKIADAIEGGVEVLTKYRYSWADGFSDADLETSREFCRTMLQTKKLYSRQDIDSIENDLGTDVWATRGGWYHDSDRNVNLPYCRHVWKQVIVTRK